MFHLETLFTNSIIKLHERKQTKKEVFYEELYIDNCVQLQSHMTESLIYTGPPSFFSSRSRLSSRIRFTGPFFHFLYKKWI